MKKTLKKSFHWLILLAILSLFLSLALAYSSLIMKDMIDFAMKGQTPQVIELGKKMMLIVILTIPFYYLRVKLKTQYTKKSMLNLKSSYLNQLFNKDINEFQEENNGKYLSNLTNDMNSIEDKYLNTMTEIVSGVIDFTVSLLLVAYIQPIILMVVVVFAGAMVLFSTLLGKPLQKPEKEKSDRLTRYTEYIQEILSAFPIIKNNNLEQKITENFTDYSYQVQAKNYEIDKKSSYIGAAQSAVIFSLITAGLAGAIIIGTQQFGMTAGGFILIINTFGRIVGPLFQLTEIMPKLTSVNLLMSEMDKTLENHNKHVETLDLPQINSGLEFNDVAFDYGENLVFKDVNQRFELNKKYLIIGPSGQGKSTLLKLLRKYFDPTEGVITISGQSFRDTKKLDYFSHLSNIEQQVFLFEDSVRNNITLYKEYSEEEIWDAIHKGGLSSVVSEFSDGLDHVILDNGKNISGGQKARIAIARGLISKASIILLDEAFASLDESVAKQIEQTLLKLENVMIINVSHVIFKESMHQYDEVLLVNNQQIKTLEQAV